MDVQVAVCQYLAAAIWAVRYLGNNPIIMKFSHHMLVG